MFAAKSWVSLRLASCEQLILLLLNMDVVHATIKVCVPSVKSLLISMELCVYQHSNQYVQVAGVVMKASI